MPTAIEEPEQQSFEGLDVARGWCRGWLSATTPAGSPSAIEAGLAHQQRRADRGKAAAVKTPRSRGMRAMTRSAPGRSGDDPARCATAIAAMR